MPVQVKEVKRNRRRKYPEGSIEYRFSVPPDMQDGLNAFINRQDVHPEPRAVLLTALKRFLIAEGDLKDD